MVGSGSVRLAALAAGAVGGLWGAAYGLLEQQSRQARRTIGIPEAEPFRADGVYLPDGRYLPDGAEPQATAANPASPANPLTFAVLGDSSAAGLGVDRPGELPGVLAAIGLAEETGRPVRLRTHAVVGATSHDLAVQVELATRTAHPDLVLVIIGANDVTVRMPVRVSAGLLAEAVRTLRSGGSRVVVGTCPDLGAIRPIPQPLRSIARSRSLAIGRAQRAATRQAGGHPVPLADLLSPEFLTRAELFSRDHFHPSAAGYAAAADTLLPALCAEAGVWGGPLPVPPTRSAAADARRPTSRAVAGLNQVIHRRQWFGGRIVP